MHRDTNIHPKPRLLTDEELATFRGPFTIDDFCRWQRVSRASYYNWKADGVGPREYVVGRAQVRISPEARDEWLRARTDARDARSGRAA